MSSVGFFAVTARSVSMPRALLVCVALVSVSRAGWPQGRSPRPRVPRQHLHDERPTRCVRGLGRLRQLRRRLAERPPGRPTGSPSASSASATPAPAPPSAPSSVSTPTRRATQIRSVRGRGPLRQLRRRLGELHPGRLGLRRLRPALRQLRRRPSVPSSASTPTRRTASAHPAVASDSSGNFVVVWSSYAQDGIELRRLRPALRQLRRAPRPRVPRQHLHDGLPTPSVRGLGHRRQLRRRLAELRPGRLGDGVFGQRYASSGTPLGPEFRVNTYTTGSQSARVRGLGRLRQLRRRLGERHQDGSGYGVFGQRYASSGAPLGPEFRVNTYTTNHQVRPSVASDASGNFVVVWTELARTARPTASSASATPAPAPRSAPSSVSTPTRRASRTVRPWPRTPPATSSSSGRASRRTARTGRLRPALRVHCAPGRSRRH